MREKSVRGNCPLFKQAATDFWLCGADPLGTRRCCDVESTSKPLIQRRNNVVCPVGSSVVEIRGMTKKQNV